MPSDTGAWTSHILDHHHRVTHSNSNSVSKTSIIHCQIQLNSCSTLIMTWIDPPKTAILYYMISSKVRATHAHAIFNLFNSFPCGIIRTLIKLEDDVCVRSISIYNVDVDVMHMHAMLFVCMWSESSQQLARNLKFYISFINISCTLSVIWC